MSHDTQCDMMHYVILSVCHVMHTVCHTYYTHGMSCDVNTVCHVMHIACHMSCDAKSTCTCMSCDAHSMSSLFILIFLMYDCYVLCIVVYCTCTATC